MPGCGIGSDPPHAAVVGESKGGRRVAERSPAFFVIGGRLASSLIQVWDVLLSLCLFCVQMSVSRRGRVQPDIIRRVKNGDDAAFELIVREYERVIYRFIYAMVTNPEDTLDLIQKTFIKVYHHIHHFDEREDLGPWIFTIAKTTTYDFLRKKRITHELYIIDDENNGFDAESTNGVETEVTRLEKEIDVQSSLEQLPLHDKEILKLYFWEGQRYVDIAKRWHIPLNTVKTRLRRAKQKFKEAFGAD